VTPGQVIPGRAGSTTTTIAATWPILRACFGHIFELVEVEEGRLHFFDLTSKKPVYVNMREEDCEQYKGSEAEKFVVLPDELPDSILRM